MVEILLVALLEQEVIFNELLACAIVHASQGIVRSSQFTFEAAEGFLESPLHLAVLLQNQIKMNSSKTPFLRLCKFIDWTP